MPKARQSSLHAHTDERKKSVEMGTRLPVTHRDTIHTYRYLDTSIHMYVLDIYSARVAGMCSDDSRLALVDELKKEDLLFISSTSAKEPSLQDCVGVVL